MGGSTWLGAALVVFGGILQGTFAVPMKYARRWKHENIWFVFALTGLVIFPWLLTAATVPNLVRDFQSAPAHSLALVIVFGVGWGIGAALVGIALNMLGIGLGFAIVLSLSASLGSLIPLLVLTPEKIVTRQGHLYILGTVVMLVGILVVSVAGSLRERAASPPSTTQRPPQKRFAAGLVIAIAAGVFSSMLNFSYAFGTPVIQAARQSGASSIWAANVVAALATTGGFLANLVYCAFKMVRNRTSKLLWSAGALSHWIYGITMGAFWFGGLAVYGIGLDRMGTFGTVIGWPLLMGTVILSSNVAGFLTHEWSMAGRNAKAYLLAGCTVIVAALLVLARAQTS